MRARSLSNRIEIWQRTTTKNDLGSSVESELKITESWAEVTTLGDSSKYSNYTKYFGITDRHNSIVVKMRKRNDITYNSINQYIVFKGVKYVIQVQPTNNDFNDNVIVLVATRESIKNVTNMTPIA